MEKAIVTINGVDYELKFTVGFWRKAQEQCGITQSNIDDKLSQDSSLLAKVVLLGIIYGLPADAQCPVTEDQIERQLERSVMDVIAQAVINGMTKQERKILDILKAGQEKKLAKIIEGQKSSEESNSDDSAKKKLV